MLATLTLLNDTDVNASITGVHLTRLEVDTYEACFQLDEINFWDLCRLFCTYEDTLYLEIKGVYADWVMLYTDWVKRDYDERTMTFCMHLHTKPNLPYTIRWQEEGF